MKRMRNFIQTLKTKSLQRGLLTLCLAGTTLANPSGPSVRHGEVNYLGGTQAQIQQLTDQAIVDWQSFSVGAQESLRILQPSELSVILNRVVGTDPSAILGRLDANGNVFLINPNGILFGPDSVVNVGGLVASSLDMTDSDFLSGRYNFFATEGQELGAVVNQGTIRVTDGGYAVLTGPTVANEGVIVARSGRVVLAAGEQATLNLDGRDLIHFALGSEMSDGTVLLAPGMLSESLSQTLGVDRYALADRLVQESDGTVRLVNSSGLLVQSGEVQASEGSVLFDSTDLTLLTGDSVTDASGGETGDGGEILVLSDMERGTTIVDTGSLLDASAANGDGGFVETSAQLVQMSGTVDLAASGEAGSFLLDPTTVRIVDEAFTGVAPPGESYVTDLSLELMLDGGANATVQSDMAILSDVTRTSALAGGTDTGIQSTGSGFLTLDTASLNGTDVNFQPDPNIAADQYVLNGNLSIDSGAGVQLGDALVNSQQFVSINAVGDIDLGSSQITADQGVSIISDPGGLVGDGFTIDTQNDPNNLSDGEGINISVVGDVILNNGTLLYAQPFSTGGLSLFTDGNIQISNSTLASESETVSFGTGTRTNYNSAVTLQSNLNDLSLINTDLSGSDISLTATDAGESITVDGQSTIDSSSTVNLIGGDLYLDDTSITAFTSVGLTGELVSINNADIDVSVRNRGGAFPVLPSITINANGNIDGDAGSANGLHGARIQLTSANGNIEAAIDTSSDGDDPTAPYSSIPTRLTAEAQNGNILISDIADSNPLGFDLSRPNGLGFGMPADIESILAGGDITVTSQDKIGFGLGDGTTVDEGFANAPMVRSTGGGAVTFDAVGALLDQNGQTGVTAGNNEIIAPGTISLSSDVSVGSLVDPFFTGVFEVTTNNLVVDVSGANSPVNVGGPNFDTVDATIDGGEFKVTDQVNGGTLSVDPNPGAADIFQITGNFGSSAIRLTTAEDLAVLNTGLAAGHDLVLSSAGSIINDDPLNPSIVMGAGSRLVLDGAAGVGTQGDPFEVQGDDFYLQGNAGDIFLDLTPVAGPVSIQGANSDFFLNPVDSLPVSPATTTLNSGGDLVVTATGDLEFQSSVSSGGGVAFDTTGSVTFTDVVSGTDAVLVKAADLVGAENRLAGGVVGLEVGQDLGAPLTPFSISDANGLVLGNDSIRSYFLELGGAGAASLVGTFTVGGVTVSGNQVNTAEIEKLQDDFSVDTDLTAAQDIKLATGTGDLIVNGEVSSNNRAELRSGGTIEGTGSVVSQTVVMEADGSIGATGGDFQFNSDALAVSSGESAYVRNIGGDMTLVDDAALVGSVGAQNEFRLTSVNGDLTVSTDVLAQDVALVGGTDTTFSPQVATPVPNVVLNGNVTATGNLVVVATGNIERLSGTLTGAGVGLGANGDIGTVAAPIDVNASQLAVNQLEPNLTTAGTATPVASVTSVGITVNGQVATPPTTPTTPPTTPTPPGAGPEPLEPGSVVVDVALESELEIFGPEFAQDNVDLVEDFLRDLYDWDSILGDIDDPTLHPLDWYNDEDFLRRKSRS